MKAFHFLLAMLLACLVAACGAGQTVRNDQAADYPFRHSDFDYRVAWKTTPSENGVTIDGLLKNVRYPNIYSLDLTVYLMNADGTVKARETTIPVPQQSRQDDVIPFSLKFRNVSLNQGDLLRFLIHYRGTEGIDDGVDWRSSFVVDATSGKQVGTDSAGGW